MHRKVIVNTSPLFYLHRVKCIEHLEKLYGEIIIPEAVIIDDALARKIANLQAFKYTGTAGVLLKAKKEGHLTEIRPVLERLKGSGFYITNKLVDEILKLAGEG